MEVLAGSQAQGGQRRIGGQVGLTRFCRPTPTFVEPTISRPWTLDHQDCLWLVDCL